MQVDHSNILIVVPVRSWLVVLSLSASYYCPDKSIYGTHKLIHCHPKLPSPSRTENACLHTVKHANCSTSFIRKSVIHSVCTMLTVYLCLQSPLNGKSVMPFIVVSFFLLTLEWRKYRCIQETSYSCAVL